MYHIFLNHSLIEGHIGFFQFLATTNNVAMNMAEHMSSWHNWALFSSQTQFPGIEKRAPIMSVLLGHVVCITARDYPSCGHCGETTHLDRKRLTSSFWKDHASYYFYLHLIYTTAHIVSCLMTSHSCWKFYYVSASEP